MSARDLLSQGQALLASQFPALVTIGIQSYSAATNGLHRGERFGEGPSELLRRISFWLPIASFTAAGQPIPTELSQLWSGGVEYQIETVFIDPTGVTCTLNCIQHPL